VREIGMRATTLTTFEGADVVVPNGTLLSEKLINWTLRDMTRRIDVNVGCGVRLGPAARDRAADRITTAVPGVSSFPAPSVIFRRFCASSLDFGIRAWTNDFGGWVAIRTELSLRVYDALRSEGIEIPFPQHDVHSAHRRFEARHEAQPQTPQPT
jgi:small-conductance mechanosensitive channel